MPLVSAKPDGELIAVTVLAAHAELGPLVAGRVSTELPPDLVLPHVRVWRVGGTGLGPAGHLDRARLQGEARGRSKAEANDIARIALRALLEAPYSPAVPAGVVVSHVDEDLGLSWSPEPITDTPRYLFGVVLFAHVSG